MWYTRHIQQYTVYYEGVIDRVGRALCLTLPELMDSCVTNPLDQLIAVSNDAVPTVKLENRPECLTGQD
jgi:hypothetical protein